MVWHERMSNEFEKFHLGDGRVLHHFTGTDVGGPHDHPWSFQSEILVGGYVERVYTIDGDSWSSELVSRRPGDVFHIDAAHIHEIVELPLGYCMTLVTAGPHEREVRFWQFEDDIKSRAWHEKEYYVSSSAN